MPFKVFTRTLNAPIQSKPTDSALPQVEFKVELRIDQDTSELAAVVRRAKTRASQLQPTFGAVRNVLLSHIQSTGDVNRDTVEGTWQPFLENLQKFTEVAGAVVEVRLSSNQRPSLRVQHFLLRYIRMPWLRTIS